MDKSRFGHELLEWHSGLKKPMPWKNEKDPYKVWLSEVILQQTRVAQGIPYYEKIVKRYPTVQDLAKAEEDEFMSLWQGLGYYSRARNLLAAANQVVKEFGGEFPNNSKDLLQLKGVGTYTAAAVASFVFEEAVPVIDGNVYRVLSRVYGLEDEIDTSLGQKAFAGLARQLLSDHMPSAYNQAIMDFGSECCKPKAAKCETCPFSDSCVAFKKDLVGLLPRKKRQTQKKKRSYIFEVFKKDQGKTVLLQKRPAGGIWPGLYQFPLQEMDGHLSSSEIRKTLRLDSAEKVLGPFTHQLSHRDLICYFVIRSKNSSHESGNLKNLKWVPINALDSLGVPRIISKYQNTVLADI